MGRDLPMTSRSNQMPQSGATATRRGRTLWASFVPSIVLLFCGTLALAAATPVAARVRTVVAPIRLAGLSCPARNTCVVFGTDGDGFPALFRTSDTAAHWTEESVPADTPSGFPKEAVTCASTAQCLAYSTGQLNGIASVLYTAFLGTTDGGTTWTTRPVDNFGGSNVTDPTCVAPRSCYAIRDLSSIIRSTNDGASWKTVPGSGWPPRTCGGCASAELDDLSCPSACFVVGQSASNAFEFGRSSEGGTRIDRVALLPGVRGRGGYLVSCATAQTCMVANLFGTMVLTTTDAGAKWVTRSLPTAVDTVHAMSCPSTNVCVALVHERTHDGILLAATTRNDGLSWSVEAISPDPDPLWAASLSCPTTTVCFVDGPATPNGSVYVRSGPAGSRWVRTAVS